MMQLKNLLLLIMLLILPNIALTQTSEERIKSLEDTKRTLQDSIIKIDAEINDLKANALHNTISDSLIVLYTKKGGKLRSKISGGEVIKTFKEGDKILADLSFYELGYIRACVGQTCGYINELWIKKSPSSGEEFNRFLEIENENKRIRAEKAHAKKLQEEKELEVGYLRKYGKSTYDKLKRGDIWIGMTEEMARISKGNPNDINRSVGSWGTHEQWVYEVGIYLYFENGKLTGWQN